MLVFFPCSLITLAYSLHACMLIIRLAYFDTCILCTWMLSLFHLHWGTYSVHVVVQVWWKCQCVSVSVEVSVFKGFSGRTLRNAFGNNLTYRSVPSRMPCVMQAAHNGVLALALCMQWHWHEFLSLLLLLFIGGSQQRTEVQEHSRCVTDSPHPFFHTGLRICVRNLSYMRNQSLNNECNQRL